MQACIRGTSILLRFWFEHSLERARVDRDSIYIYVPLRSAYMKAASSLGLLQCTDTHVCTDFFLACLQRALLHVGQVPSLLRSDQQRRYCSTIVHMHTMYGVMLDDYDVDAERR